MPLKSREELAELIEQLDDLLVETAIHGTIKGQVYFEKAISLLQQLQEETVRYCAERIRKSARLNENATEGNWAANLLNFQAEILEHMLLPSTPPSSETPRTKAIDQKLSAEYPTISFATLQSAVGEISQLEKELNDARKLCVQIDLSHRKLEQQLSAAVGEREKAVAYEQELVRCAGFRINELEAQNRQFRAALHLCSGRTAISAVAVRNPVHKEILQKAFDGATKALSQHSSQEFKREWCKREHLKWSVELIEQFVKDEWIVLNDEGLKSLTLARAELDE